MKKIIALVLAALMMLSLCACGASSADVEKLDEILSLVNELQQKVDALSAAAPAESAAAVPFTLEGEDLPLLFATRTCPNCRQAEKLLDESGVSYRKVLVEEHPELAKRYGVRQAPTLLFDGGETPEKLVGVGAVRKFIAAAAVKA